MRIIRYGTEGYVPNITLKLGRVGFGFYACVRISPSHALRISHGFGFVSQIQVWNCTRHPVRAPRQRGWR